jgi:hypothetical protein
MAVPFQHKIDRVEKQIGVNKAVLALDQNRYAANRKRAFQAHKAQLRAQTQADHARGAGRPSLARKYDHDVLVDKHVAYANHLRAQHFLGEIKRRTQIEHDLETRHDALEENAQTWLKNHGLHVAGNKVIGEGTDFDKWIAACQAAVANCANNRSRNFYSMEGGGFNVQHCILGGARPGERYDCSVWVTGMAWSCGFDDPNGTDFGSGYTGTLIGAHGGWHEVSLQTMLTSHKPGYIVYGSGVGHHTEAWCPSTSDHLRTAGHGSAPVDYGTTHLFGSGEVERYFIYN